ncbi:MAG TPA: HlyD family secretion protein [Xanthobacteraceae bacterium]|jgi:membrane fusion protein (multidrug efflux system)
MVERVLKSVPKARTEGPDVREVPPTLPAAPPAAEAKVPAQPATTHRPPSKRKWPRRSLFALLPLALVVGGYWYVTGGQVMSTDDAYVQAERVGISTDVSGIVQKVEVTDNQHVAAGQILYSLDPRQFQIALDDAKANLAQTALTIDSMKQDYKHMLSDAAAEQSQVDLDQTNYNRDVMLLRSATVSQAAYDQAQYTLQTDKNKFESLRQQAQTQLARLGGNADIPTAQHPQYLQSQAKVAEAQRELNHTVIKAPFAGTVTEVSSIAPGKYLAASTTAFYLVDTDHVWIEATPKETELTYVRPGQAVTITVDAYPNAQRHGTVESISPAGAQEFSLLPAQNTSGNWVKVVQRVPIRVRVDTSDEAQPALRAGMSVEVAVDTGHTRGLPHFLTALFDHI